MLGSDWLQAHNCLWDFGRGRLFVDGRAAVTLSRKRPLCCRRLRAGRRRAAARQETDVPARSTLLSPRKIGAAWIIDSHHAGAPRLVRRSYVAAGFTS